MPIEPRENPFVHFDEWYEDAKRSGMRDPNGFALATAGKDGMPSVRIVLLKGHDERGFVFYTNLESDKGRHLKENPQAAADFWWHALGRQCRIQGAVEQVNDAEADAYFASRPRMSRIGAWASIQSRPMEARGDFEKRIEEFDKLYPGEDVPRPPHWSGFRIKPVRIEFWREAEFRLHERIIYTPDGQGGWTTQTLYP